jgi:cell shape-determining protein MreC
MKYVGKMEEVNQGDALVTSGISQTFPKGLLIGYVQGADRL